MPIIVKNPPQRVQLEEYECEINKYLERAKGVEGVRGVMSMGSIGAPGLSDIDLICVVDDDMVAGSAANLGVEGLRKDLFLHGPVIVPESMISQLQYIIYASNLISIMGDDYVDSIVTPEEDLELLKLMYLIDFTESRYGQYAQVKKRGYIDQRAWMTRLWSITHTAGLADDLGIDLSDQSMEILSDVRKLRSDWLEGDEIEDDWFVKVFINSEKVLSDVFKTACELAFVKLGGSQLPDKCKIIVGIKRICCQKEESSIRGEWGRVPRISQYITTYANSRYALYLRKYGFDILDDSYDDKVSPMSLLMKKRASMVRHLYRFHRDKNITFSMGGYLGLPLSKQRKIDSLKFRLGWIIGNIT